MENEIWKDVVGYESIYQVSDHGRVKSLNYMNTRTDKILKHHKVCGYPRVCLRKNGVFKMMTIHSLMAQSFIDKDYLEKKLVVNHKNFKRDDNRLANLEVVTNRENTNQRHMKGSSMYVGVSWCKKSSMWKSRIVINGVSKYLGVFGSEKEAYGYYEAAVVCIDEGRIGEIETSVKVKSSIYKFIRYVPQRDRWRVEPRIGNKVKNIGYFKTEEQAYNALQSYREKVMES